MQLIGFEGGVGVNAGVGFGVGGTCFVITSTNRPVIWKIKISYRY